MIQGSARGDSETKSSADANLCCYTPWAPPPFNLTQRIMPSWEVSPRLALSSLYIHFLPNSWLIGNTLPMQDPTMNPYSQRSA
jgi:hypothetical protein